MEAYGLEEIEQEISADSGDFYTAGDSFGPATNPSSQGYDGTSSGVEVYDISSPGPQMTATFALSGGSGSAALAEALDDDNQVWAMSGDAGWLGQSQVAYTSVALTAVAEAGYVFDGWSGDCTGIGSCVIDMTAARNVTAEFSAGQVLLREAVDNASLGWADSGDEPWFGQTQASYFDGDAAQSGKITDAQSSQLEPTLEGPGTLFFYWRVSSEDRFDFLRLWLDGTKQAEISGAVSWERQTLAIPAGQHGLRWSYDKNSSVSGGDDAGWIDQVVYVPDDGSGMLLSVTTNGQGSVTSTPSGIDCGTDCGETYPAGT